MSRYLLLVSLSALFLPAADPPAKSALDKATLEAYVRHLFVINPPVTVQISDPKPSDLPGFVEVRVRVSQGTASQEVPLLVTKDGKNIVQGAHYNVNTNPFKSEIDKLKTQLQPNMGTPGAPVVLVVFSDLQCPHCKDEAKMLRQNLLANYPTQVHLYFKDFPIDSLHPWARAAAIAGRCVFRQTPTTFWDYHDWIFDHQDAITSENLKDQVMGWAKGAKDIDALQLGQCMDTKATASEVEKEVAEGQSLEIGGTPTLFVNGRRIPNTIDWPNLKAIIDYEIEYQKTAKNAGEDCGCEIKLDLPGLPKKK